MPGKAVSYPRKSGRFSMALALLRQFPGLLGSVYREHRDVRRLVRKTGARILVSDNRYGCFSGKAVSVFVGHQVFLRAPGGLAWAEPMINAVNHWFIRRFRYCLVPDNTGPENLSGALSMGGEGKPAYRVLPGLRFVGPLSRFTETESGPYALQEENLPQDLPADKDTGVHSPLPEGMPEDFVLVMLSGPEPQRTLLEAELVREVAGLECGVVFVRGLINGSGAADLPEAIAGFSHLPDGPLAWLIRHARLVICRPGYSTLMDLAVFGKKVLVVPTPGQTEQEYLGRRIGDLGWGRCVRQGELNLADQMPEALAGKGIPRSADGGKTWMKLVRALLEESGQ